MMEKQHSSPENILKRWDQVPHVDNQMKNLSVTHRWNNSRVRTEVHIHESGRSCPHSETQGAFTAPGASCFPEVFLIGWPSLFLSEWGSGSKVLSVCNDIPIRGKHDQSLKGGGRGDSKRQGERRCISQGVKGAKQQGAEQGRNKNRPLTLSAVTRAAASCRRGGSVHGTPCRQPNPVSGLVL